MLQGGAQSPCPDLEIQLLKEENETLKNVIEQMKIDMQTIVEKVKSTFNDLNEAKSEDVRKNANIRELESKLGAKDTQIARLKEERDRLIQISNDLRADLNRSQRLVNDLMSREMNGNAADDPKAETQERSAQVSRKQPTSGGGSPVTRRDYIMSDGQEQIPIGMFDAGIRMSTENQTHSPGIRNKGQETFGEGQLNMRKLRGSREGQLYQESLEPVETDPRLSQHIKALQPTGRGAEHDKILEYGAQLNDIALQLQEWVSIYQSHEGNEGGGALFSINAPKNARAVQQLGYAKDGPGQGQERVAFGRSSGPKSARSASSRKRGRRSRSHSRSRSFSRSKSREGKQFIQRIEKLRQNLEVEGQAIHSYFRKTDDDRQQKKTQSDKMTISQYKAAN